MLEPKLTPDIDGLKEMLSPAATLPAPHLKARPARNPALKVVFVAPGRQLAFAATMEMLPIEVTQA